MPSPHTGVSVVMPVRNGQFTLAAALGDLIVQLGVHDEILVIDDGSEDATARILSQMSQANHAVRVITTPGVGLVDALNLGLREATHRWVARADVDDRYPPDRLAVQRRAIAESVVLISGDYRITWSDEVIGDIPTALTHPFVVASLVHPQRVPHPGVMIDRDAVAAVGGYKSVDYPVEDLGLWLRLASAGRFVGVPHVTVDWTMSAGSITHRHQSEQRRQTSELLHRYFPRVLSPGPDPAEVERELDAYRHTRLGADRRLLLARDLRALLTRGATGPAIRHWWQLVARDPLDCGLAAGRLARQKLRRDRLRATIAQGGR